MGTAGTGAQTHQGDGEPHLSTHDGGSDADAEGYYQLDAACDPQYKTRRWSLAKAEEVRRNRRRRQPGKVNASKGNFTPGGKLDGVHNLLTKYQLDMLGAERDCSVCWAATRKNGQMEKMAQMLNDGQYRRTKDHRGRRKAVLPT